MTACEICQRGLFSFPNLLRREERQYELELGDAVIQTSNVCNGKRKVAWITNESQGVVVTTCGHIFHEKCFNAALALTTKREGVECVICNATLRDRQFGLLNNMVFTMPTQSQTGPIVPGPLISAILNRHSRSLQQGAAVRARFYGNQTYSVIIEQATIS